MPEDLGPHLVGHALVQKVRGYNVPQVVQVQLRDAGGLDCPLPEAVQVAGLDREVGRVVGQGPGEALAFWRGRTAADLG